MKPVTISLNVEKNSMFFIPGKLHLTYDEPGPVEINPTELTDEEKRWINDGYRQGFLNVDNPNKKAVSSTPASKPATQVAQKAPAEAQADLRAEQVKQAKALLGSKLSALKETIPKQEDILMLRLLQEAEGTGKKRKVVLDLITARLEELQNAVLERLGGDPGELPEHITDPSLKNLPELEVEEKIVTDFKLASMD